MTATAAERLGPYRLQGLLGRGGMGEVWLAEHEDGARVALKVLRGALGGEDAERRFAREIETLRGLDHPGIVAARGELGSTGDAHYYPMELVVGRDLAALLRAQGPLEPGPAIGLACQVLEALAAAHRAGVVHRDVKPANVLVDREGRARLTDFGLARVADRSRLTAQDAILGTPAYLSPEQARGEDATERSDLYAVGVLLFELLTGRPPFEAENPLALLRQHIDDPPPNLTELASYLPAGVDEHVRRALEKEPGQRFASAEAMADALRITLGSEARAAAAASTAILRERVTRALEASPASAAPAPPPPRPRRRVGPSLLLVGALTAGAAAWFTRSLGEAPSPVPVASPSPTASPSLAEASPPAGMRVRLELSDGTTLDARLLGYSSTDGAVRCWDLAAGRERVIARDALRAIVHPDDRGGPPR